MVNRPFRHVPQPASAQGALAWSAAAALARLSQGLGALLFAGLAAGCAWMLADTWPLDERTDVLGLPIAPERIVAILALACVSLIFLAGALGADEDGRHVDRS